MFYDPEFIFDLEEETKQEPPSARIVLPPSPPNIVVLNPSEKRALEAAKDQDIGAVMGYLGNDGNVNIRDKNGRSLLLLALSNLEDCNEELALALLDWGVDRDGTINLGDDGFEHYLNASVLHCAYLCRADTVFNRLLEESDIDLNAICDEGREAVHFEVDTSPGDNSMNDYVDGYALDNATVLHFAALKGDIDTIQLLCITGRVDVNARAHLIHNKSLLYNFPIPEYYNYQKGKLLKDGREKIVDVRVGRTDVGVYRIRNVTPLRLAAMAGHVEVIKYLTSQKADVSIPDSTKRVPYWGAVDEDQVSVVKFFHEKKRLPLEITDPDGDTPLCVCANKGIINTFLYLLGRGAEVTERVYRDANNEIGGFLLYQPGRKSPKVIDQCEDKKVSHDTIKKLWLDYEDSTDDESTDEEDIEGCEEFLASVPPEEDEDKKADEHWQKVEKFNTPADDKKMDNPEHQDLRYVIHRGVHFDPKYFDKKKRQGFYRDIISSPHAPTHTFSYATEKLLEKERRQKNKKLLTSEEIANSDAHKEIQGYLQKLKKTPNKKPRPRDKRKTEYARLIQDYVHLYAEVINKKRIQTDFEFVHPYNPLISTSYLSERAFVYASGMIFPKGHRLNPHYRRSTGRPKHPFIGVVYSYAIDVKYAFGNSVNVLDWNHQEFIGIKGHYQHECEVIFESWIPREHMVMRTLLKMPDFSCAKGKTPPRLGYADKAHQGKFTRDQKAVCELKVPINSDINFYNEKSKLNAIIHHVIKKEDQALKRRFLARVYSQGVYPCYPFKNQTLSMDPIKPPARGRWGDQENVGLGKADVSSKKTDQNLSVAPEEKSSKPSSLKSKKPKIPPLPTSKPVLIKKPTDKELQQAGQPLLPSSSLKPFVKLKKTADIVKKINFNAAAAEGEWYDSDRMRTLLNYYIGHERSVRVLDPINAHQDGGKTLTENLNADQLQEILAQSTGSNPIKTLVIPIYLGRDLHWAGLYIHFHNDNRLKPTVGYFDPYGDPMPEEIQKTLVTIYTQLDTNNVLVSPIRLQRDDYNCGPWMVAILDSLVKQGKVPSEDFDITQQRRKDNRVLQTLHNHRDFFKFDVSKEQMLPTASKEITSVHLAAEFKGNDWLHNKDGPIKSGNYGDRTQKEAADQARAQWKMVRERNNWVLTDEQLREIMQLPHREGGYQFKFVINERHWHPQGPSRILMVENDVVKALALSSSAQTRSAASSSAIPLRAPSQTAPKSAMFYPAESKSGEPGGRSTSASHANFNLPLPKPSAPKPPKPK